MYFYIKTLKQRLDAINQLRINRAQADMGPVFQKIYNLLPILLHYHHPIIPGYLEKQKVPYGINFFAPNKIQSILLKDLSKGVELSLDDNDVHRELPIIGLYSMGSTSSVGQNSFSDLDIWVCHQTWLSNEERINLHHKCILLKKWCISMGLEISFFLMDENYFRQTVINKFDTKHLKYTKNIFLLDEFYRTAVRIAGRYILWNVVPREQENNYNEYVMYLYANNIVTPNEWLDFGGINTFTLPITEYLNACLLQIYKSFNSPYKAVLKALLLEVYIREYPNTTFLATNIKQCLHEGKFICFGLDPYCMMLKRLTCYLITTKDMKRLDLVRRCFYLKVCETISRDFEYDNVSWRRNILSELVKEWKWDNEKIVLLNHHSNVRIDQINEIYKEFIDSIMQIYHNLIYFTYYKTSKFQYSSTKN